jgi:hypothetical protein
MMQLDNKGCNLKSALKRAEVPMEALSTPHECGCKEEPAEAG